MARTGRVQHRRGGFRSKARKLMAVCLGGALLFSGIEAVAGEPVEDLLRRNLSSGASGTQGGSGSEGNVATCPQSSSTLEEATLTLSKRSLTATLVCQGESPTFVPTELSSVCDGQATSASGNPQPGSCTIGTQPAGKKVTLQEFLGASHEVSWIESAIQEEPTTGKERTLQLAETDLPRTDKKFAVGCQKTPSGGNSACKVTVTVNARPSSVDDKNVVTCAYGKDSNPKVVEVEMSEEKNTLTIDCGSDGSMQPAAYTSQYCFPEGDTLEECSKANYSDILPTFETSWWTEAENDGTPAVLTIPKTDFPGEDQRLLLGCAPKSTAAGTPGKASGPSGSATTATSCRVVVTVKAASSASSASFTPQTVAATAGATVLPALLAGSM